MFSKVVISRALNIFGLKIFLLSLRYKLTCYFSLLFNSKMKEHNKDYKSIPIIIISYNQLYYLKKLVKVLKKYEYKNIIVLDNNSNYPPLLEYLDKVKNDLTVYKLNHNYGHRVFWKRKDIYKKYTKGYYVITDPDCVPIEECPDDFLKYFKTILDITPKVNKVGFSLKIDDIPNTNKEKETILKWERQFWERKRSDGNFEANIDTTFALYRPKSIKPIWKDFFKAIRTSYPYTCIHGGWYIDFDNLTQEQAYYIKTIDKSSSWLNQSEEGKLKKYKL